MNKEDIEIISIGIKDTFRYAGMLMLLVTEGRL